MEFKLQLKKEDLILLLIIIMAAVIVHQSMQISNISKIIEYKFSGVL